ncbi:hypothetical protein ACFX11_032976 [Malus domestica]
MAINLDLTEEKLKKVITHIITYQQQLFSNYNKKAKILQFQPGDLVLRKPFVITHRKGSKKMDPISKSPYKIRVGGKGSYTFATMNNEEIKK